MKPAFLGLFSMNATRNPRITIYRHSKSVLAMETNGSDVLVQEFSVKQVGRRSGGDRRNYSYTLHIPERRKGKERRSGNDRRQFPRTDARPE
jgi:hypothetical protein